MINYQAEIDQLKANHRYRQRKVNAGVGVNARVGDAAVLNFCSNDYLGLSNHPRVVQALVSAAKEYGVGAGASHLVSGHHKLHHQLEERLADFVRREKALVFSTGYMANLAVVAAFCDRKSSVVEDKLNHASLIDAAALSGAKLVRYQHGDPEAAAQRLQQSSNPALLVTDAVFSMDGDLAPMNELAGIARALNVPLMIDDAHGFGVLGDHGRGSADAFGLSSQDLPLYMATLGKAAGVSGAFVAGDADVMDYLLQKSRPYIYSTAMPIPVAAALMAAIDVMEQEPQHLQRLQQHIQFFKQNTRFERWHLLESNTAIQPLVVNDDALALRLSESLMQQGFWVSAIRPPTVPENTARLRITLSAAQQTEQIARLCQQLQELETQCP